MHLDFYKRDCVLAMELAIALAMALAMAMGWLYERNSFTFDSHRYLKNESLMKIFLVLYDKKIIRSKKN